MVPEIVVLITSSVGILVSGYLLYDAAADRIAIRKSRKIPPEKETELDSFTRHRGIAETIRFFSLVAWFYVAAAALAGNEFFRRSIVWVLIIIPILITVGSIHSWWAKKQWVDVRTFDRHDMS